MKSEDILKGKGLKVTESRISVLELVMGKSQAMCAKDIFRELSEQKQMDIEYSTVYRIINLFVDKDILIKYDMKDGKYYYKYKTDTHLHTLKCKLCSKETEIECPLQEISEKISRESGFSIDCSHIELEAVCNECKAAKKRE